MLDGRLPSISGVILHVCIELALLRPVGVDTLYRNELLLQRRLLLLLLLDVLHPLLLLVLLLLLLPHRLLETLL